MGLRLVLLVCSAFAGAIVPDSVQARNATQAEIDEAEASFLKAADQVFLALWNDKGDKMAADGITATAVRQYASGLTGTKESVWGFPAAF